MKNSVEYVHPIHEKDPERLARARLINQTACEILQWFESLGFTWQQGFDVVSSLAQRFVSAASEEERAGCVAALTAIASAPLICVDCLAEEASKAVKH